MAQSLDVVFPGDETISGSHPIVLIGPNGSGKTRLGVELARKNNADRIPALRNLALEPEIPPQMATRAKSEVDNQIKQLLKNPWSIANEITNLISQMLAEDSESARHFRDEHRKGNRPTPPETKLTKLVEFWQDHFPERELDLSSYTPRVTSKLSKTASPYPMQQMSDGERVALYLAARVINSERQLIIVDEPEVHFHPILARQVWDGLEALRAECRFIYITHDLPFALSRRPAQFGIVQSVTEVELLPVDANIPETVIQSVLGAASFSIVAKRIVFCEGTSGQGIDHRIYEAWFNDRDTAVIPVGGSENVVECVRVFNSVKEIRGLRAIGIVDRDYWPDPHFETIPSEVHVLKVHEIESLLCLPGVFKPMATHLKVPGNEIDERYERFLENSRAVFKDVMLHKQVLERARRRLEKSMQSAMNAVRPSEIGDQVKAGFCDILNSVERMDSLETIFREESERLEAALASEPAEFLKYFPGKSYFGKAANELGLSNERFLDVLCGALSGDKSSHLHKGVEGQLETYLPPRKAPAA